ncbi:FUSC family protein [Microbulbifer elongatus]|uniref:FUSC family protein n=1 Tax=Microbulbifer elongatus TaxID=86173 RepID=UPI001CFD97F6|nr:FUSC family protein [Microbulbifer elongatus]
MIFPALKSRATREALKTALALVLTYWIALQANWDKPMWAGLAVALVSLDSLGLSLNKGLMRMLGTLVAAVVALVLVGLFPQDRWLFMAALSMWVGCCTYLALGSSRAYFWQVCGFVSVIICVGAATSQGGAFETAVLRAQQTGLGVLVYSLVAILLWPSHSGDKFRDTLAALHQKQRALHQKIISAQQGVLDIADTTALAGELAAAHRNLRSLLEAAIADSYDVWEARNTWKQYLARCEALTECLEQLALLAPGQALQRIKTLIPSLPGFDLTIQQRFGALLAPPKTSFEGADEEPLTLSVEKPAVDSLSFYDAGSFAVVRRQLRELDRITRELLSLRTSIDGHESAEQQTVPAYEPYSSNTEGMASRFFAVDGDRLIATLRVIATLWAAYLIYIYVEGVPAGSALVTLTGSLAMALATVPQVAPLRLVLPVLLATTLAGLIYLLVMPKLYAFWQLALLLFSVSFLLCRLFASPATQGVKALAFSMFISVCSIQNAQTYSFMAIVNISMAFVMVLLLLSLAAYVPNSPRPEQVFRRHLKRFFCTAGRMTLSCGNTAGARGHYRLGRGASGKSASGKSWRANSLYQALTTLPVKISESASRVPAGLLPGASRDMLDTLIGRISALAFFMQTLALHSTRDNLESDALRQWRKSVANALFEIAASLGEPDKQVDYRALSAHLQQLLDDMESKVRRDVAQFGAPSADEVELWLCRAGLLRGIGLALVDVSRVAGKFNWTRWDEQRFF